MSKPKALFVGRFQPCSKGHQWLFETKLKQGIPVLIAIRDIKPDEKNPLTAEESAYLIRRVYQEQDVTVIIIPDIESINWGRGVGYETNEHVPPAEIGNISATQIRKQIADGSDEWKKLVDSKIWDDVFLLLSINNNNQ